MYRFWSKVFPNLLNFVENIEAFSSLLLIAQMDRNDDSLCMRNAIGDMSVCLNNSSQFDVNDASQRLKNVWMEDKPLLHIKL
jgi:hypothetical protein